VDHLVEVSSAVKRFGTVTALDGIDLTLGPGEICALVGPNGAGKTTLVRILGTQLRPDGGRVMILGEDAVQHPRRVRSKLAVVPQGSSPDPQATPWEHVYYYLQARGLSSGQSRGRAETILRDLDLWEQRNRLSYQLSGGYQRRVLIAMALSAEPVILLLDEPTAALDPSVRRQTWHLLAKRRGAGTILITTHDMVEAEALGDKVGMIGGGRLVAMDAPEALRRHLPFREKVIVDLGSDHPLIMELNELGQVAPYAGRSLIYPYNHTAASTLMGRLVEQGQTFSVQPTNLEDVYLALFPSGSGVATSL